MSPEYPTPVEQQDIAHEVAERYEEVCAYQGRRLHRISFDTVGLLYWGKVLNLASEGRSATHKRGVEVIEVDCKVCRTHHIQQTTSRGDVAVLCPSLVPTGKQDEGHNEESGVDA